MKDLTEMYREVFAESKPIKKTKIELVEDRYTGTLYEMEVEDEESICPVVKEYEKHKT
jgi:hypothetical protein